jgi:hypothetical protein
LILTFEAREYPGRKDLWENLILELAEQLDEKDDVLSRIEGKQNNDKKAIVGFFSKLL